MDKLKKTIELIENNQNTLSHYVVDPGVNITTAEMFDLLLKEIEWLKGLLKQAFRDGTKICTNLDDHDFNIIWEDSEIYQKLKGLE